MSLLTLTEVAYNQHVKKKLLLIGAVAASVTPAMAIDAEDAATALVAQRTADSTALWPVFMVGIGILMLIGLVKLFTGRR